MCPGSESTRIWSLSPPGHNPLNEIVVDLAQNPPFGDLHCEGYAPTCTTNTDPWDFQAGMALSVQHYSALMGSWICPSGSVDAAAHGPGGSHRQLTQPLISNMGTKNSRQCRRQNNNGQKLFDSPRQGFWSVAQASPTCRPPLRLPVLTCFLLRAGARAPWSKVF